MTGGIERAPITPESDKIFRDNLVAIIPSLRSFARGLCGNRDLADDLAQDAMTRAWSARQSFEPGSNFRAWMFMILRNQFYTTVRKNARMVNVEPEFIERALTVAPSQQDRLHVDDVARALQKLNPEQREVLMLVGANGVPYEEAAQIIGCAVGTIKSRLARGRTALAALLAEPTDVADVRLSPNTSSGRSRRRSEAAVL